jgi:hypothetical protein
MVTAAEAQAELARRAAAAANAPAAPVVPPQPDASGAGPTAAATAIPGQDRALASQQELQRRIDANRPQTVATSQGGSVGMGRTPGPSWTDLGKSALTGARGVPEGAIGMAGDILDYFGVKPHPSTPQPGQAPTNYAQARGGGVPTTAEIHQANDELIRKNLPASVSGPVLSATSHPMNTQSEQEAGTLGAFSFGAAMPGGPLARVTRVVGPAAATEISGEAAKKIDPALEGPARVVAGILAGGLTVGGENMFRVNSALRTVKATPGASEYVLKLLRDQGMTADEAAAKMRTLNGTPGPGQAILGDVGPSTRMGLQRAYSRSDEALGMIRPVLQERMDTSDPRLAADVTATMGPRVNPTALRGVLEQRANVGAQAQEAAHPSQVAPIDLKPTLDDIDAVIADTKDNDIRSAMQTARSKLFGKVPEKPGDPGWQTPPANDPNFKQTAPLETDSQRVLRARQAIGAMVYDKTTGAKMKGAEIPHLDRVYASINDAIDPANPTLRAADKTIEQAGNEEEALKYGQGVFKKNDNTPNPMEFQDKWNTLSQGEKDHVVNGINDYTWNELGHSGNDKVKLKNILRGGGKDNFEKLRIAIGDQRANQLMGALEREATFAETYADVVKGSKTSVTMGGDSGPSVGGQVLAAVPDIAASTLVNPAAGLMTAAQKGRGILADVIARRGTPHADIAEALLSRNPDDVVTMAQAMKQKRAKFPQAMVSGLLARKTQKDQQQQP